MFKKKFYRGGWPIPADDLNPPCTPPPLSPLTFNVSPRMAWLAGTNRSASGQHQVSIRSASGQQEPTNGVACGHKQVSKSASIRSASGQQEPTNGVACGHKQVSIRSARAQASGQHQVSKSASKADKNAAGSLTDYKFKIPVITYNFLALIINRLHKLRIMFIMLNTLIHKDFLITSYNYCTNSAAFYIICS